MNFQITNEKDKKERKRISTDLTLFTDCNTTLPPSLPLLQEESQRSSNNDSRTTLFRKRNSSRRKRVPTFDKPRPIRKPRGITERGKGRRNSIRILAVINDVSRSPGVGLLRREGFATHEIFLGQRPPSRTPRIPGPTTRGGGGKRGKPVHDFLVSGGRLEFLAVVNTFYEILWKSS